MRVLRLFLDGGSFARARRRLMRKNERCVFLTVLLMGVAMDCNAVRILLFWHTSNLLCGERCLRSVNYLLQAYKLCWSCVEIAVL